MSKPTRTLLASLCLVGAIAATQGVSAQGHSGSESVRLASGTFRAHSWALSVKGHHRQRCYRLSLSNDVQKGVSGTCRPDRRPKDDWAPIMGIGMDKASVQLLITRPRVRRVRLLTAPHSRWITVHPIRISAAKARRAGVKRNFRFAVIHGSSRLCIKKGVTFNKDGERIDRDRVPCQR